MNVKLLKDCVRLLNEVGDKPIILQQEVANVVNDIVNCRLADGFETVGVVREVSEDSSCEALCCLGYSNRLMWF